MESTRAPDEAPAHEVDVFPADELVWPPLARTGT